MLHIVCLLSFVRNAQIAYTLFSLITSNTIFIVTNAPSFSITALHMARKILRIPQNDENVN